MASTRLPRLPATPASNTILLDDRRFHDLLPDEAWGRLPLAIRRRFSRRSADGETALRISVEHEALVFRSVGYSLQIGPLRLPLPMRLTPGDLTVTHSDLGGGTFRFTLEIVHPRFGKLIRQSALFREAAS
jgi:hypothetical protein